MEGDFVSHGGFLHPSIGFSTETRTLEIVDPVAVPESSDSAASVNKDGATQGNSSVMMMRIPKASMITFDLAVSLLSPWWPNVKESIEDLQESRKLYSSIWDVLLALALAYLQDTPGATTTSKEDQIARAYLATLPSDSTAYLNAVPWRWSERDLETRLRGSPLLNRARQVKEGVRKDYSCIVETFHLRNSGNRAETGSKDVIFPVSLDRYCDMMVVVSSRAFVIDASTDAPQPEVALIPILDLCDHCRGGQDNQAKKKNLSYNVTQDGSMIVQSTSHGSPVLPVGETLRLTYGAKGNADLLLHYGFAIPFNLEPDGSSNDILELTVPTAVGAVSSSNESLIRLRTGPKAYTYGCLVKALEAFQSSTKVSSSLEENLGPSKVDMESFLDEEEDEDDEEDAEEEEDVDLYGEVSSPVGDMNTGDIDGEVVALERFGKAIEEHLGAYSLSDSEIHNLLANKGPDADYYSALLIHAEKRTLHFFAIAVHKILAHLQQDKQLSTVQNMILPNQIYTDSVTEQQIDELVKAYMIIRHNKETEDSVGLGS